MQPILHHEFQVSHITKKRKKNVILYNHSFPRLKCKIRAIYEWWYSTYRGIMYNTWLRLLTSGIVDEERMMSASGASERILIGSTCIEISSHITSYFSIHSFKAASINFQQKNLYTAPIPGQRRHWRQCCKWMEFPFCIYLFELWDKLDHTAVHIAPEKKDK